MTDSILPKLVEEVSKLERFAQDESNDRAAIFGKISKLLVWLVSNRSLQEHRCAQAYLTFLYQSYGDEFISREDFVDWVKYQVGYCKVKITEATIKGERVVFKKFKPQSLSFAECSQKLHNAIFQKIQKFALSKWGVNFDDWHSEWLKNEHLVS